MKRFLHLPALLLFTGLSAGLMAQSCPPPTAVNTSQSGLTLTISLSGPDSVWVECEYQVRASGDLSWKKARRPPGDFDVNMSNNLDPLTTYELRSRCACSVPPDVLNVSPFGPPTMFTTPDLPGERLAMMDGQISLYPNPAISETMVTYTADFDGEVDLFLHDMTGKVVYQQTASVTAGANQIGLDVSQLNNGMYFFRATAGQTEHREALQIVR